MKGLFYILFFLSVGCFGQQTNQFTQFTFNKYGYNPAAAGTNINAKTEVICGVRKQWVGFDKGPATNFFSGNYTFKPQRSYKRWHNAGLYIINDKAGIFQNFSIYGSYTLHMPLTNKLFMSFGIFAGARRFSVARSIISEYDPIYSTTTLSLWTYPDIIPGIRVYNKKMFFDVSIQQIYHNRQSQGEKQIGSKSVLAQEAFISYGRRFFFDNGFIIVPALNIHGSYTAIPSIEFNLMAYYQKRIGIGGTIRNKDFASAIIQLRIYKTTTIGIAYDYSLNKFNSASPHTIEVMFGITPMMLMEGDKMKNSVAKCPTFDF